jgi:hypothetical protein
MFKKYENKFELARLFELLVPYCKLLLVEKKVRLLESSNYELN